MSERKRIAFIFARGGSKGLPRKNVLDFCGKPLIAHAIETALASSLISRVICSTDDAEIAAVAERYGAEVPFTRPAELAADTSSEWMAWQHAIDWLEQTEGGPFDTFISLPTTAPLRSVEDVERCVELLEADETTDIVITVTEANRSPYFNMVTLGDDATAKLVIEPNEAVPNRQAAPSVYDMTTVAYVCRPNYVKQAKKLFQGRVKAVQIPVKRAIDIDTPLDFKLAEFLASI